MKFVYLEAKLSTTTRVSFRESSWCHLFLNSLFHLNTNGKCFRSVTGSETRNLIPCLKGFRQKQVSPYQFTRSVFKSNIGPYFIKRLLKNLFFTPSPPATPWNDATGMPGKGQTSSHTRTARDLADWHSPLSWPARLLCKIPQRAVRHSQSDTNRLRSSWMQHPLQEELGTYKQTPISPHAYWNTPWFPALPEPPSGCCMKSHLWAGSLSSS